MAQHRVQYIQFYTDGTAARKLEIAAQERKTIRLPSVKKQKRRKIYVDPVAILGVGVAICMLIVMAVGFGQLDNARQEAAAMEQYVTQLSKENEALTSEYAASYDLEAVEKTALALGMVPSQQVPVREITVTVPQIQQTPTVWENIGTFLTSLFA